MRRMIDRAKAKPSTIDILIVSGGGDWGAFGAGFLKGWGDIKGDLARPQFDTVTGVSTGALIAPFAFLGDERSIDTILDVYRHPRKDWVKWRQPLYFWPSNTSFASVPGLEKVMREHVNAAMLRRIGEESKSGRMLLVNTTDLDGGGMYVWNVGDEAASIRNDADIDRVHQILLASAGIPAAFPFRLIDGTMYVDGGITNNILYGGRTQESDSIPARWQAAYPGEPMPKLRYWIIFNNQLRPLPQVTDPTWPAIVARATETCTRAATLTSLRHLFAQAEISRLKRGATIEIRLVAVPNEWSPPKPGVFVTETMNSLADLGEKMGRDASAWITESP